MDLDIYFTITFDKNTLDHVFLSDIANDDIDLIETSHLYVHNVFIPFKQM